MKKMIFLFILFVVMDADVVTVINEIKKMQTFTPQFKKMAKYDIFGNFIINKKDNSGFNSAVNEKLQINAVFQNRININGSWYKTGDIINGYKIIKINNNEVVMKKNGKIKTIIFKSNIIKVVK